MTTKITVNPKFEFLRNYIETIPQRNEDLGDVIYKARNVVYKDVVQTPMCNGTNKSTSVVIKSFKIPPFYNRIAYTYLRKGKAIASYINALTLIEKGFSTPEPIACIRCYEHGLLSRSYYISALIEGHEIRMWEKIPDNEKILQGVAQLMVNLHRAGVFHRDFTPGNVMYDKDLNFYLLDINRMRFGVTSHKTLMTNFKSIHYNADEIAHLAEIYANLSHQDVKLTVDEAMEAHHKYLRLRHRKQIFKNLIKIVKKSH